MQDVTDGVGICQSYPIPSLSKRRGENGGPLPTFFILEVSPPHFGSTGSPVCWQMRAGMCRSFTQAGVVLSELESPDSGLPLLRSSPCRTSGPSVSLINPSKNNSPDRLEKQNPNKQADVETEQGKQVLHIHKLIHSWDRGD